MKREAQGVEHKVIQGNSWKSEFAGVTWLGADRAGRQNFGRGEDVSGLQGKLLGDSQREIQIDFSRGVGRNHRTGRRLSVWGGGGGGGGDSTSRKRD